jgi:hypothetical protein
MLREQLSHYRITRARIDNEIEKILEFRNLWRIPYICRCRLPNIHGITTQWARIYLG